VEALIEKAGKDICNCGEKHKLPWHCNWDWKIN